jgi:hypothetical protein
VALTRRAEALGKTRSELVRELIEKGLEAQPLGHRIGHLKGILDLPEPSDPMHEVVATFIERFKGELITSRPPS